VTFRPEFDAPWVGRPYVAALIINRLAEHEAGAMIDRIVGNMLLSASIRQDIIERTDGIPLFVEEMTKAVLEAGSETAAERALAAVPSAALAVPASLHASHGAARPARRPGQGAGTDRGGNRPRVFACLARLGGEPAGGGAETGVGPSHRSRFTVPTGRAPACDLSVQTCPRAGRGLRDAAARAATHTTCPHRRNHRERIRGKRREPTGVVGATLDRGRPDRESRGPLGQSGAAVAGAVGAGRSRRAAHAGSRPDCDVAQHACRAWPTDQATGRTR